MALCYPTSLEKTGTPSSTTSEKNSIRLEMKAALLDGGSEAWKWRYDGQIDDASEFFIFSTTVLPDGTF
jgi:hypothetical protein